VFAPPAFAGSAADRLIDAVAGAHAGLLVLAVALHVGAQASRGLAWRGVLAASWPQVTRRRACAWHVCGAGMGGVLSARGGDALRIALAKRDLREATWPALAGTLAAEGSFETVCSLIVTLVALRLGVGTLHLPPAGLIAAAAVVVPVVVLIAARSERVRGIAREAGRGLAVLTCPRRWAGQVLPFQIAARVLRLGAAACFLLAFGLPAGPTIVLAAAAAQGSGAMLPLPGAGPAAAGAAILVAVPMAAGGHVDTGGVAALALAWPLLLTCVGVVLSTVLLAVVSGARSPRALLRAARALGARPAPAATPAPAAGAASIAP
jgi:NAD(P)H-dependent flavin oxidoreductase YrpB (nitropropane dioxygenase family)